VGCALSVDSDWFQFVSMDPAYVYSLLFITSAFKDLCLTHSVGKKSSFYMVKTLAFLRDHVGQEEFATSDSTILVIFTLLMTSLFFRDTATATKHLHGIKRIVDLRGGLSAFRSNPQLQVKLCRYRASPLLPGRVMTETQDNEES
jgi:hypothetical protein